MADYGQVRRDVEEEDEKRRVFVSRLQALGIPYPPQFTVFKECSSCRGSGGKDVQNPKYTVWYKKYKNALSRL